MDKKTLGNYVYEQHRQGMTDSQIARRMGMSVEELAKILSGEEEKAVEVPQPVAEEIQEEVKTAPKKRGRPKKVAEEVKVEPPKEEFNWMDD